MSTVVEIEAALSDLAPAELLRTERAVHLQVLQRVNGIIYEDGYGPVTEHDLIASAEEAFLVYDKEEAEHARRQ